MRARTFVLTLALAAVTVTGCRELLVEPARAASLALSLAAPAAASAHADLPPGVAALGAAFDRADRVRIRLLRGEAIAADETLDFAPAAVETRVRIEVELESDAETLDLELHLLAGGNAIFSAGRAVTLEAGRTTEAEVELAPVAGGVAIAGGPFLLEALGDRVQLIGAVVLATGDAIPGLEPTWTSGDPAIVEVSAEGLATAVAEGEAELSASHGAFSATTTVRVHQAVAAVTLVPDRAVIGVGGTLELVPKLHDPNGHPIPEGAREIHWTTSSPAVADVDGTGTVTALAPGTATITATTDGVEGTAAITVPLADRIAFTSARDGHLQVYAMYDNGAGQVNLSRNSAREEFPKWSPDGNRIAFASTRHGESREEANLDVYVMDADGGNVVRLTDTGTLDRPHGWSPDGARLLITSDRSGHRSIWSIEAVPGGAAVLVAEHGGSASYSPDGSRIVFERASFYETGEDEPVLVLDVWVMDADGSNPVNLTANPHQAEGRPSWSPDGSRIAFTRFDPATGASDVWTMTATGTDQRNLTESAALDQHPAWQPNPTRIAFHSNRAGDFDIFIMDTDGSNPVRLTFEPGFDGFASWRPRTPE